ncbi:hypothetical protein V3851_11615 [Paenibacillus sp. M1]|uniref:DUF3139 domain-containing protein n=1 Tax=Paenibacillus haidiansis TaxID=1574488 RepID=A0ABU7VU75_9BACL
MEELIGGMGMKKTKKKEFNMRKKLLVFLIIIVVIFILIGGFRYKSYLKKREMVDTATKISQEYIKRHYNKEFILKKYDIIHPSINTTIFLDGYIVGNEDTTISITYDYVEKEVRDVWGPEWFIDGEKSDVD